MDQSKQCQQNQKKSDQSDSSSEFHESQECLRSNSSSQCSRITYKKKIRRNITKASKWRQNVEKKKNYKIVNTFIMCHLNQAQNPKYIIETEITDFKRKIRSIKPEEIEEKSKKMAEKQRNSIMNHKYNNVKKNMEKNTKLTGFIQTTPNFQKGMNPIYTGIDFNYMLTPIYSQYYGIRLPY